MTNSGETEKVYAGQQGGCALWKARSLAAQGSDEGEVRPEGGRRRVEEEV